MMILDIVLGIFILLEISNVVALYFNPSMKEANAVGVFKAWDSSKKEPEIHEFIQYLIYWVAGTKLIFLSLLVVILFLATPGLKIVAVFALIISITFFYWKMFPLITRMDEGGMVITKGYSRTLGIMIGFFIFALSVSAILALIGLT